MAAKSNRLRGEVEYFSYFKSAEELVRLTASKGSCHPLLLELILARNYVQLPANSTSNLAVTHLKVL